MKKIFLLFFVLSGNLNGCEIGNVFDKRLFSEDIKEVQEAINEGANANINEQDKSGNTPLMIAAFNDRPEIARLLIKSGADVNAKSSIKNKGFTALINAYKNSLEMNKLLIESGADVNAQDEHGRTALMPVSLHNKFDAAELLIKSGADVNLKNNYGFTALMYAVECSPEVVKLLLDSGADINILDETGHTALMLAKCYNNKETAKLIEDKIESLKKINLEFINAAREGKTKEVVQLIEQGVNINAQDEDGFTALMRAAQGFIWSAPPYSQQIKDELKRKLEITKILLEKKADFTHRDNVMHWTALEWARESKNQDAVNLLKAAGATE